MSQMLRRSTDRAHLVLPDIGRPLMAKANVQTPDIPEEAAWQTRIGMALAHAVRLTGWTHKEAAAKVGVDDAEFGKWMQGTRRPHLDRLYAVPELRVPLTIGFASIAGMDVHASLSAPLPRPQGLR